MSKAGKVRGQSGMNRGAKYGGKKIRMSRWPVFFWRAATNKIKVMMESGCPYVTSRERASEWVYGAG